MYEVYWIKAKEHTDPKTQGYIGVTSVGLDERLYRHKKYGNPFLKKILKGEYSVRILHRVESDDLAYFLEEEWRPKSYIGANVSSGGKQYFLKERKMKNIYLKGDERTEKQKEQSKKHSKLLKERYKNDESLRQHLKQNGYNGKGKKKSAEFSKKLSDHYKKIVQCPHCKKEGTGVSMLRWHFSNCKKIKYD